jgi:hypothetical protein
MDRKLMGVAALVVAVGCGGPETRTDASPSPSALAGGVGPGSPAAAAPMSPISGEFAAEVVSVDATTRMVTLRESAVGGKAATAASRAGTVTVSVEEAAGDSLRDLKKGDHVVVSCMLKGMVEVTGTASPASPNLLSNCSAVNAILKAR